MPFRPNDSPEVVEGIGIDEMWRVVRRSLWLTRPLVIGTLISTAVLLLVLPPSYTAQTTVLIEPETPQVLNMTQLIEDTGGSTDYDYYKTQFELLKSRTLAARVIRELNLSQNPFFHPKQAAKGSLADLWHQVKLRTMDFFYTDVSDANGVPLEYSVNPQIIDTYLKCLRVEPVIATRLVKVSFSLPDAALAARITNVHVNDFVKQELEIRSSAQRTAEEFLKAQLTSISERTERAEAALNEYRQHHGVLSFNVNDTNKVGAQRMSELTTALTTAETRRITAQSQYELIKHGGYESLPQVVNNPTISALKPQLVVLESEYARLSAAFNPAYPKLMEVKAQRDEDRRAIAVQIQDIANAVRRDYQAALAQENRLRDEIQVEKQRDLALNDALLKDAVLSREVQTNRDLYKNVLQRMEEMSVASQTPLSNISVVEKAVPPRFASSPQKKIDLAIAAVAAILVGLALSFVIERLDKSLKNVEEIETYLNLPNLAVVPDFRLATPRVVRQRVFGRCFRRKPSIVVSANVEPLSELDRHRIGASEVYRVIRASVLLSSAGSPPRTILVTSSIESEGKTWTAIHTAAALAQTGAPTLLISCDLRRPHCDTLLNCEGAAGLSDILAAYREPEELIYRIEGQAFSFLAAGSRVSNPAELLGSVRMSRVVDSLAQRYSFVLFDSAPVMHASETLALAAMTDGVVMVVGADTPRQNVRIACDRLHMVDANILGVVLNGVDVRRPDYREYTNYYHRNFRAGAKDAEDADDSGFEARSG